MKKVKTYFKKDFKKKKKKKRGLSPAKRDKVYNLVIERDKVCQNPFCKNGWPLDVHHVLFKSQYGKDKAINLILICRECHDLIHSRGRLKIKGEYPNWTFTLL